MKWKLLSGVHLLSLVFWFLLLTLIAGISGCTSIEQIREASQETALNTKALVDIEGAKNPENKGVSEIIVALEKGLGGIPKPKPFQIPDWVKIAAGILGILLFPTATKLTLDAGKSGAGMIGKIVGAISNGKGKK